MKNFTAASIIGSALVAATIGLATPALAAPSGSGNAQETISSLQAQGYKVIVKNTGSLPLGQANVVSVRQGDDTKQIIRRGGDTFEKVLYTTVYVDVK